MIELEKKMRPEGLEETIEESFQTVYAKNLFTSSNGDLIFTADKVYFFCAPENGFIKIKPWCINISEIAENKKYGLAGYSIILAGGKKLKFQNVGKKLREGIDAAIAARKK